MGVEQQDASVPLPEQPTAAQEHVVVTRTELEAQPERPVSRQALWQREKRKEAKAGVPVSRAQVEGINRRSRESYARLKARAAAGDPEAIARLEIIAKQKRESRARRRQAQGRPQR